MAEEEEKREGEEAARNDASEEAPTKTAGEEEEGEQNEKLEEEEKDVGADEEEKEDASDDGSDGDDDSDDDDSDDDDDDDDSDESGDEEPSDAEDLDEEDEEEEDEEDRKKRKKKKRKNKFIDDVADEDDDEDDRRKKKKKRAKGKDGKAVSRFIDDIADAAGSDDEEDEEGDEDEPIDDAEREALAREMDTRLHARVEQAARIDAADDEELERMVKERYESRRYADAYDEEGQRRGPIVNEYVDQQSLHPTVRDPKLWMVPVKQGKEREVTICLMQKMINLQKTNKPPMKIMSVVTQDHLKGYVYVEAMRDDHVKKALQGLRHVYHMKPPRLVPLKEMVESISVVQKEVEVVRPDSWVRMRSGVYKADLAKVVEVNYGDNSCVVKILPRFDYQHLADKESGEAKNKPKPTVRPAARLFSETEAKNKNLSFERGRFDRQLNDRVDVLCGTHKIKDGYLLKRCALTTVKLTEAPSLDEIQKFAPGGDDEDDFDDDEDDDGGARRKKSSNHINRLAKLTMNEKNLTKNVAARFLVGDQVIVVEGDLRNLEGVIKRVDADGRVIVDPSHKDLTDPLPFNPEQLRKHFKVGSTVRVVHGAHEGASGMVVKVSDQIATIFSTSTNEEFSVFMRDLADDAEAATRVDRIGEYALHDLAMLDDGNVGVLTRVEKDVAFVLTNVGTLERPNVKACKLSDFKRKMNSRNQTAQDGAMELIDVGSIVRINEGQLKDVNATVEHIYKGTIWVKARGVQRDGGIVCLRSRQCFVHGGQGTRQGGAIPGLTPAMQSAFTNAPKSPGHALIAQSVGLTAQMANASGGMYQQPVVQQRRPVIQQRMGRERTDPMVGKLVTIRRGVYAGYKGKVVDCGPKTARVELQAQARTVTVNRDELGGGPGSTSTYGTAAPAAYGGYGYGQQPVDRYAAQTPAHTAATPAHGSGYATTPARDNAWNPTMTPGREDAWGADEPAGAQAGSIAAEYGKNEKGGKKQLVPDGYDGDYLPGTVVKLMNGSQGVVKRVHGVGGSALDVQPGISNVKSGVEHFEKISRGARAETVAEENVELVVPLKGDDVIVVNGDERGEVAELVMVDGADGVLKIKSSIQEKNGEVIIVDMSRLARYFDDK